MWLCSRCIWKYYPPTGVLKHKGKLAVAVSVTVVYLEVLPAYWDIKNKKGLCLSDTNPFLHLEGCPFYWGIETFDKHARRIH